MPQSPFIRRAAALVERTSAPRTPQSPRTRVHRFWSISSSHADVDGADSSGTGGGPRPRQLPFYRATLLVTEARTTACDSLVPSSLRVLLLAGACCSLAVRPCGKLTGGFLAFPSLVVIGLRQLSGRSCEKCGLSESILEHRCLWGETACEYCGIHDAACFSLQPCAHHRRFYQNQQVATCRDLDVFMRPMSL